MCRIIPIQDAMIEQAQADGASAE